MLQDAIIELFRYQDCLGLIMGSPDLYTLSMYLYGMDAVYKHSEEFNRKSVLEEWYSFAAAYYSERTQPEGWVALFRRHSHTEKDAIRSFFHVFRLYLNERFPSIEIPLGKTVDFADSRIITDGEDEGIKTAKECVIVTHLDDEGISKMGRDRNSSVYAFIRGALCYTWFDFYREISQALGFADSFSWSLVSMTMCMHHIDCWKDSDSILWVFDDWQLFFQASENPDKNRDRLKDVLVRDVIQFWIDRGKKMRIILNERTEGQESSCRKQTLNPALSSDERAWLIERLSNR